MEELTDKQKEILHIIDVYINARGFSPSLRDIKNLSGLASTAAINEYLIRLREKGYIEWYETMPRTIRLREGVHIG